MANDYAREIEKLLADSGLRVKVDDTSESVPKKIREAQLQKVPLIITIGNREKEAGVLAVRTPDNKVKFGVKPGDFLRIVKENIERKEITISF